MKSSTLLAVVIVGLVSSPAWAERAKMLRVGDPAPAFRVGRWFRGTPLKSLQKGHIYVIDFWATRCGPCVAEIPHLARLAQRYKGKVEVTGISVLHWQDGSENDTIPLVKEFMKTPDGKAMQYNVAADTPSASMVKSWFAAAGYDSIPHAFVVGKDRRIAWMGEPSQLDSVLARLAK